MSLDSVLYLAGAGMPAQMEAALLREGLFEAAEPYKTVRRVAADAIVVSLFTHTAPFDIYEEIGIKPKLIALFSCTNKERSGVWTSMMVRGLVTLLDAFEDDALFLHAPDKPALMRKASVVTIDPRCGLWGHDVEPQVLPLLTMPYAFGIIPIT
jgi:hypothetical protein